MKISSIIIKQQRIGSEIMTAAISKCEGGVIPAKQRSGNEEAKRQWHQREKWQWRGEETINQRRVS